VRRPPTPARGEPAKFFAGDAYDPVAGAGLVAWQRPDGVALLRRDGDDSGLNGRHPALGGGTLAYLSGDEVVIADAASGEVRRRLPALGAQVIGVSDVLLAWRAPDAAGLDVLWTRTLGDSPGEPQPLAQAPPGGELGRPDVVEGRVLFHVAGGGGSRLVIADPADGTRRTLRSTPRAQLTNPSSDGRRLLHVHASGRQQELRLGPLEPHAEDEVIAVHPSSGRRDREHERGRRRHRHRYRAPLPPIAPRGETQSLWSTALAPDGAFVTRIVARPGQARRADILRVALPVKG
jgi:hypothetical protein